MAVNSINRIILNNPFYKLSKVFIVRLCVIQFTRYILFAAANFYIITQLSSFVKNFFQVFPNFFSLCYFCLALVERLRILAHTSPFVKYFFHFFTCIFQNQQFVVTSCVLPQNAGLFCSLFVRFCTLCTTDQS